MGKVSVNPTRDVRHRREDNSRVRFLGDAEEKSLRKIIEADYAEHLPELELALSTWLRKGSMYSLTWEMLNWNGRMLNIPTSKNEEVLHIPLNNTALAALRTVYQRGEKTGPVFQSEKTGKPWPTRAIGSRMRLRRPRSRIFTGTICGTALQAGCA